MSGKMKHDITGKRFGKLVATSTHESRKKTKINPKTGKQIKISDIFWLCQCDCGNTHWVKTGHLLSGQVRSCGCLWAETMRKPSGQSAKNGLFASYKKEAEKRKYPFSLSFEDFIGLTQKECYYCGSNPSNIKKTSCSNSTGVFIYNGLDRVDNTKGYEKGNVVACCSLCNRMKLKMNKEDFISHVKKIARHKEII